MEKLGFPIETIVDDNSALVTPTLRMSLFLESDISFLYQTVSDLHAQLMQGTKNFKPMHDDNGDTRWPPTFIMDTDDDLFNVMPLNTNYGKLGIKRPDGEPLLDGDEVGISHPLEAALPEVQTILNKQVPMALPGAQAEAGGVRYIYDKDGLWHVFLSLWKDGVNFDIAANRQRISTWREIMRAAQLITCSTLGAEQYVKREIGGDTPTFVTPNAINFDEYPIIELSDHPNEVRILWEGSACHHEDLWPLNDVIARLARKYPHTKWLFWGAPYKWAARNLPAEQVEMLPWVGLAGYKVRLSTIGHDISIAPLVPYTFNQSRSAIRWYESSAIWRPAATLAQATGSFAEEITDNETGLLFTTTDEFEAKLGGLIEDAALRSRLAANAKDWVRTHREVKKITTSLFQKWVEVREGHKQSMPAVDADDEVLTSYLGELRTKPAEQPNISLSIVIPTLGRETLARMLGSLAPQIEPGDEVLVVGDGPQPNAERIVNEICMSNVRYIEGPHTERLGNAQRDLGRSMAKGDFLWFVDDDDEVLPDTIRFVRSDLAVDPARPHHYIMILEGVPFMSRRFMQGHIGNVQLFWPNRPDLPSHDAGKYGLDMEFISAAIKLWPEGPVWHNRIIYRYIEPKGVKQLKPREVENAVAPV